MWGKCVGEGTPGDRCREMCPQVYPPTSFPHTPTYFPTPAIHFPYISPYLPHTPSHFFTPPLIPLPTSLLPPPHPNTFSYYPHISLHLLKVWRSYHVTKLLWRSCHVAKLLATVHINTKTPKTTFIPQHSMPFRFNKFLKLWLNITQCQTHWMLCISKNAISKSSALSKSRNKFC